MKTSPLDALFKPQSVAVIGASDKERSLGQALVHNLKQGGFKGAVYPINPNYAEIQGLPAHPSISAVGAAIDLAVVAIPIREAPAIIEECGQAGVAAAVIISAGGREAGPEGQAIEAAIAHEARRAGLRYLGPNSMGLY